MDTVLDTPVQQVLDAPSLAQANPLQLFNRTPVALNPDALLQVAVERGDSIDMLERLLALKERVDKATAKQAFDQAFASFKAKCSRVIRNTAYTDGPLKGKKYASLFDVVETATGFLSEFGLSASWLPIELPPDEDKIWVRLACVIRHVGGHSESVPFGGPVDTGTARSPIQARKSTTTILERMTFLMATGMAESDADDDGQGGPVIGPEVMLMARLIGEAEQTTTDAEAAAHWKANSKALLEWPYAYEKYKQAVAAHRTAMKQKVSA